MPIDPERLCPCHGEPMLRNGPRHTCRVKRHATWAKYRTTENGREKRRTFARQRPDRRIFIGHDYHGTVKTAERAQHINDHIRRRLKDYRANADRSE